MKKRAPALIVLAVLASVSTVLAQAPKVPPGCTPATGAKAGHGGYADRVVHKQTGIELVLIGAGKFTPQPGFHFVDREVKIGKPFYIGKTEVTNGQYRKFVNATGYDGKEDTDPAYDLYLRHWRGKSIMSKEDDYPIVWVSWKNAKAFCEWAGLTLPSETQWEYACRAGAMTLYYFGADENDFDDYGWVVSNSEGLTHPVGQKKPNAWGLYDMLGNVWEWVEDDYVYVVKPTGEVDFEGCPTDERARVEGKMTKVLRGGAWSDSTYPGTSSCGARFNSAPTNASNDVGFRVVLPVNQET